MYDGIDPFPDAIVCEQHMTVRGSFGEAVEVNQYGRRVVVEIAEGDAWITAILDLHAAKRMLDLLRCAVMEAEMSR